MKKVSFLFFLFLLISTGIQVNAQENQVAPDYSKYPRNFAMGFTFAKESGFGGMIRFKGDFITLDASIGFHPILVATQNQSDSSTMEMNFEWSKRGSVSFVIFFSDPLKRFQNGIRIGGCYDTIFGWGPLLGWEGDINFKIFTLNIGAGLMYFHEGGDKLEKHLQKTLNDGSKIINTIQFYLGLNLMWYLF